MRKRAILLALWTCLVRAAPSLDAQEVATIPLGTYQTPFGTSTILGKFVLSPDEKHVAFCYLSHLKVVDLSTKAVKELRSDFSEFQDIVWSPDSTALYIMHLPAGNNMLYDKVPIDGSRVTTVPLVPQGPRRDGLVVHPISPRRGEYTYGYLMPDHTERAIAHGNFRQEGRGPWLEWSPDRSRLVTMYWRADHHHLLLVDAGTGTSREIAASSGRIEDFLWSWRDGLYFSHPIGDRRAELFLYPVNGGPRRSVASAADGYSRVVAALRDGTIVALRYRPPADFWDGMLEMIGHVKNPPDKQADLVLFRAPK